MTKDELIAALGKATGPSRELDGYIYMLTLPASRRRPASWEVTPDGMIWAWTQNPPHAPGTGGWWATPPEYTASIDAALTLVPEGHQAVIWTAGGADVFPGTPGLHAYDTTYAATPALALCIAALRARA